MAAGVIRLEDGFNDEPDCAVVALAMYLDVRYADVIRAAALERDKARDGLSRRAIIRVAGRLGHTLRKRRINTVDGWGIISAPAHSAVLLNGRVLDRLSNWPLDVWLKKQRAELADCDFFVMVG
jgi:hypothetical protein